MSRIVRIALPITLAVLCSAAGAHHSAAEFDFDNRVLITGTVVEARFANPHLRLVLEVTDDERGTRNIEFEGHSRNNLRRMGLRPDTFAVGEQVTIRIAPMHSGADGGYVTGLLAADGTQIGQVLAPD